MKFDGLATVENVVGISRQGQTLPIFVRTDTGDIYLAKYASKRSTLSARELSVELLANFLGQLMGLFMASPVVLSFSAAAARQAETLLGTTLDSPFAIGLRYTPIGPFLVPSDLRNVTAQTKGDLLLLDVLLANGDRVPENPNVAWADGGLLVFDHEHCLEFPTKDFEGRFSIHRQLVHVTASSHLFREAAGPEFSSRGRQRLKCLDFAALEEPKGNLPDEWLGTYCLELDYLRYVATCADSFLA